MSRRPPLPVLITIAVILIQTAMVIAAWQILNPHSGEAARAPYVATWDATGWQVQSDGTAFRTALDSRGQYTEVTCQYAHQELSHCSAIADDGRRITVSIH